MDRAALDVALKQGIDCGGWCPAGRLDEFGEIPEHYPLEELTKGSFAERTLQNVEDSDGTVIFYFDVVRGGTQQTVTFCLYEKRPYRLIDAAKLSVEQAAESISDFVRDNEIQTLNVAGPRQSEWGEGYDYAFSALDQFLPIETTRNAKPSVDRDALRSTLE